MYISNDVLMLGIAFLIGLIIAYKAVCGLLSSLGGGGFMHPYAMRAPLQEGAVQSPSSFFSLSTVILIVGFIALIAFFRGEKKESSIPKQNAPSFETPRVNVSPSGTTNNRIRLSGNSEHDQNVPPMNDFNQVGLITAEVEVDTRHCC